MLGTTQTIESDLAVVGGGLAGVCAAIAAARRGHRVALVQNRPVLGGNSSSEVRVWVCGATAHGVHQWARETGIMGELWVENQYRNREGNPYYWDMVVLEKVKAEPNIELFLNTEVTEVDTADGRITGVRGWQSGSERRLEFTAQLYADCTGDGIVGALAGASWRTGREAQEVYDESWAPDVPDDNTLGSTILFYTKDLGKPSPFVPPPWAVKISETAIPTTRTIKQTMSGCDFWWIELGGDRDVVADNEEIRDDLQAVCYGIFDHIKNSGEFEADNLTLEWIGSVPGKREYRRFEGEITLTQHDILEQTEFEDRVAHGGWSIDLHPPGGVYASERGSRHWHPPGNYHIPLRALFSPQVSNLWFAGRALSASHVAFGSVRVMATCALTGEAAGLGAALSLELGVPGGVLAAERLPELQAALAYADASVLGLENRDPADLARQATASASSTMTALDNSPQDWTPVDLADDLAIVIPVDPSIDGIEVAVRATQATTLRAELWNTDKPQNYLPHELVAEAEVTVDPSGSDDSIGSDHVTVPTWVQLPLAWAPEAARNTMLILKANPDITLHEGRHRQPGTVALRHRHMPADEQWTEQFRPWKPVLVDTGLAMRVSSTTQAYAPDKAVGGYARPYGGPQTWVSAPLTQDQQPWLELAWQGPQEIDEVVAIFDDDIEVDLINLHHHTNEELVMPTLVTSAVIEVADGDGWRTVAETETNRARKWTVRLDAPVTTDRLRLRCRATGGTDRARVVALRAY
ncbi:FAD-dependent oxidoreductase [Parenemella sanctibonifatiensis]|uniref:Pyridine nucleotide-disulfide oxidoreductase n=1 Tax=Parenemella sanctibonifatiensis TaxID=2016505 RepID=A0A255EF45_9ACTN|nr:FAD-dependent oxidoreductase [Parenemella sanctibonifatiensis]OYN89561.1 pyridine nucleotide-disulfide oxidoreductase [Parenemella sanctibonifatiensis]